MKLVRLSNGKYAIRRCRWLIYEYLDVVTARKLGYWWSKSDRFFKDCQTNTEQEALDALMRYKTRRENISDSVIREVK